jgi:Outer membrane protein/protective antigen OMA87
MSFLPVPFVFSDPNEGQTFGLRFTLFFKDPETDHVRMILAPKIAYNTLIKTVGGATFLKYFSLQENLNVSFGLGQEVYREVFAAYENRRAYGDRLFLKGSFRFIRDPFGRFWGLGNDTPESNQSDYVGLSFFGDGEFGYYLLPNFRIGVRESWNTTHIQDGIIPSLPSTNAEFGLAQGVVSSSNLVNKVALTYDSRPLENMSTQGLYSDLYFVFSTKSWGSDDDYAGFGFDVKKLWSFRNERFTTVVRGHFQKLFGDDIPFYLQSSLGGPNELRGFPRNRFIDLGKMLLSVEQRIRVGKLRLLKTNYHISLDPFFEVGEVFHGFSDISFSRLQPVGGLGIRIKIPPLTLIRADAGFGREGLAFFVTAGYPF